jgi:hypothetical protein
MAFEQLMAESMKKQEKKKEKDKDRKHGHHADSKSHTPENLTSSTPT